MAKSPRETGSWTDATRDGMEYFLRQQVPPTVLQDTSPWPVLAPVRRPVIEEEADEGAQKEVRGKERKR